jgi:hypothetical protein
LCMRMHISRRLLFVFFGGRASTSYTPDAATLMLQRNRMFCNEVLAHKQYHLHHLHHLLALPRP